jgi:hypothetical protein
MTAYTSSSSEYVIITKSSLNPNAKPFTPKGY